MREPNNLLRAVRLRRASPSGSGRVMSRQEVAEAANAYLYAQTGRVYRLDANHIGKLEQGVHRWPSEPTRRALRAVLGASRDADLGFYITQQPLIVAEDVPGPAPVPGPDQTERSGRAQQIGSGFGCRLKELRELRGLSFRRLGQQVHYSHGYLWELESGAKRPTGAVASALDAALGAAGELSALASEGLAASAAKVPAGVPTPVSIAKPASVPASLSPASALTLTVMASTTGAIQVVIKTVPPDHGTDDEFAALPGGGAQVYSLARARRARAIGAGRPIRPTA